MGTLINRDGSAGAKSAVGDTADSTQSFGYVKPLDIPKNRGCEICNIKCNPYRSKHCHDCNRCVRKFDHHCFWVGGCVGELNHGKFWMFNFF